MGIKKGAIAPFLIPYPITHRKLSIHKVYKCDYSIRLQYKWNSELPVESGQTVRAKISCSKLELLKLASLYLIPPQNTYKNGALNTSKPE